MLCVCVFREKLHEAHSDLQRKREVIDDLEPHVDSNSESTHSRRSKVILMPSVLIQLTDTQQATHQIKYQKLRR